MKFTICCKVCICLLIKQLITKYHKTVNSDNLKNFTIVDILTTDLLDHYWYNNNTTSRRSY